jgi:PAS domain S-box-containing protein
LKSLRTYLLVIAALFVILLTAAAAVLVRQTEAAARAETRAQMLQTARAMGLVVDGKLQGYVSLLQALASSGAAQRRDFAALDRDARQALRQPGAWIVVTERSGEQRVNTRLPQGARLFRFPMEQSVWAELDKGAPSISNLRRGALAPQTLRVDMPIMEGGKARYAISAVFQPSLFRQVLDAQRVPERRYAAILDREGTLIWRNAEQERYAGQAATPDVQSKLRSAAEGTMLSRSLDGVATELAFSRSPDSGWVFLIAAPRGELGGGLSRAFEDGAILAALLLAAALGVGLLGARALMGDIGKLAAGGARIRAGQPPAFARSRFEEFGALSALLSQSITERDEVRERFDLAQEVGGIGSWDWDSLRDEGRVSDTYKRMHGLTHVEGPLKFAQVLEVIHPDDREGYLERLAAAKTRPEPSTNAYRVVHADGSVCWVHAKGRPIFDEGGRVVRSLGIVRDATAEHEAEMALRRLNEMLERQVEERTHERDRLWSLARDPFVVTDHQGVWLAASPAWATLLGHPLDSFVGRTSEWLQHPDDVPRMRAEHGRLAAGEVTERFESRFRAKDGTYRWLSWTAVPDGGRVYGVARDVTAEKEQAQALKTTEAALRQAQKMEAVGQITGGVAHDFNNLLTPIVATLDRLGKRGVGEERSDRMVAIARRAAGRARTLVQQLLAFSRRQPLRTGAVDLKACLDGMRPLLETTVGPKVAIEIDVAPSLAPAVADANQLELAILNLAVNARDAMPDGGALAIRARLREVAEGRVEGLAGGDYVELTLRDTGVGMPADVIERAIEPFFTTKGLGHGTGLGLSMVHGLMAQLGGGMEITSALGEGTTVRLWLRPGQPEAAQAEEIAQALALSSAGRVLLVDDEPLVRTTAAHMLADLGYEVVECHSADAALALLGADTFDIVVTDHLMPGRSGAELGRIVRERWPSTELLIVSGYADVNDIAPDLPRLSKPFTQIELAQALLALAPARSPAAEPQHVRTEPDGGEMRGD